MDENLINNLLTVYKIINDDENLKTDYLFCSKYLSICGKL